MPVSDYTPTVEEVASVIATRTFTNESIVGSDENLAGTFNEDTRPTDKQAEAKIAEALTEVAPRVLDNEDTTDQVYDLAKTAVARRAAHLILVSYFEQELDDANNVVDEVLQLYKDALEALGDEQGDSEQTAKGIYSIPMRSEVAGYLEAGELLP